MRVLFYTRGVEQVGVGYLMSYMEKRGHQVNMIFDPGLDNNLYYRLDILKFLNKWDQLIRYAVDWKPDLVAFSAVTNIFPFALEFSRRLKKHLDVPFVFGGIHATILPEYVLKYGEIDYVIRGEGEYALDELATAISKRESVKGIKNLCYRENGKIKTNPLRPLISDLDSLPFPRRDEFYRGGAIKNQMHIITARGCPFKCTYCVNNFYKNKLYQEIPEPTPYVRQRSPVNTIEEIKFFINRFPIDNIFFNDEVFIINKKWLVEFLNMYRQEIRNVSFSFGYYHRFIDDEIAELVYQAGGNFAQGAIETADPYLRHNILKRTESNEDILRAMETLRRHKIKTSTSAIFGIPYETRESRWKTVEFVEKSMPDMINAYLMYPFPGTEIAEIALKGGYLSPENWEKVKQGLSSYHQNSLLKIDGIRNAATMAKLLPLYIKVPRILRPFVRAMMKTSMPGIAHFIYVATTPFIYSGWARRWIIDLLNMFYVAIFAKNKKNIAL